ncbi:MAG: M50 family metallopeptidase [Myxococcota bacterium]
MPIPNAMDLASIVVAVLALGVLVIIHEGGHYLAAKWGGMSVSKFAVGFGPALVKTERGGTVFLIGAIPFGGYVQIDGMHPEDGTDPDSPASFANRPRHLRAAAILAGPAANYIFAFLMLFAFYVGFATAPQPPFEVLQVQAESPAATAGLEEGDVITGLEGRPFEGYDDLIEAIEASEGKPLLLDVERDGERKEVAVAPQRTSEDSPWRMGIGFRALGSTPMRYGPLEAIGKAGDFVYRETGRIMTGLASLISAPSGAQVSGPVGIVKGLSTYVQRSGVDAFLFVAQLSIMLGFFNLLPIPALDGARLMFLAVGAVRRREVEPRLEAVVHGIGFLMLLGLMVVVSYFDLVG